MEITVKKTQEKFEFKADNGRTIIPIVSIPEHSHDIKGFRPMEMLLASLAGCLSIDVLSILYKQKQEVNNYVVKVEGERVDEQPSIFSNIKLEIIVNGKVDEVKLQKAIDLGIEKYCSVYKILNQSATITCKYTLNNE